MVRMGAVKWLTYKAAAKRVRRSERAIRLWGRQGMPLGWKTIEGQRTRVVREDVLLETWRRKMKADPNHQARLRRLRQAQGLPEPSAPARVSEPSASPRRTPVGRTAPDADLDAPRVNPLADLAPMRAGAEWGQVGDAMKTDDPSCWGIDAFTADRVDEEEQAMMAGICDGCPLVELCRAFAIAERPAAGFWAGMPARAYA